VMLSLDDDLSGSHSRWCPTHAVDRHHDCRKAAHEVEVGAPTRRGGSVQLGGGVLELNKAVRRRHYPATRNLRMLRLLGLHSPGFTSVPKPQPSMR